MAVVGGIPWVDPEWLAAKATARPLVREEIPDVIYNGWKIVNKSAIASRGYGCEGFKWRDEWRSVPDGFFNEPAFIGLYTKFVAANDIRAGESGIICPDGKAYALVKVGSEGSRKPMVMNLDYRTTLADSRPQPQVVEECLFTGVPMLKYLRQKPPADEAPIIIDTQAVDHK